MNLQAIFNIAEICALQGVQQVVLSPGSRCAPLTLAFARHPSIQVRTISDERAAAFIALGMALTSGRVVGLVCTSGTAALNYAPAIAEAFYQQVPLLIFTADRPAEWIDQLDGQTIRQENIYNRHVKRSFSFPADGQHPDTIWYGERLISEAILETQAYPLGPVHINVPLREPFYPTPTEPITYSTKIKVIHEFRNEYFLNISQISLLRTALSAPQTKYAKILMVVGQQLPNPELADALLLFAQATGAVLVADVISNLHQIPVVCRYQDIYLNGRQTQEAEILRPDLLITFGLSNISKNLKQYLRIYPPQAHWHVQPAGTVADPFQSLTQIIRAKPLHFFTALTNIDDIELEKGTAYQQAWQQREQQAETYLHKFVDVLEFNEFTAYRRVLKSLPAGSLLHLANSMSVRYANIIGLAANQQIEVYCNRGTSGIDGCTSTAVGSALCTNQLTVLITGDLAFFYDRNALWHNYLPQNLRIVLLNNHAGGIFRLIDGPRQQPELADYFETYQPLNAEQTAQDFKLAYYKCESLTELADKLPEFWQQGPGILEIITDSVKNAAFFDLFKQNSPFR